MTESEITQFINEMRDEYHLSPFREDSEFVNFVKDGIYDINGYAGEKINYSEDLKARRLLKHYVLYADYKKIPEFKIAFIGEYDELQRKYFVNSKL